MSPIERIESSSEGWKETYRKYDEFAIRNKNDIDYLQSWLVKQPHLPKLKSEQLSLFLMLSNQSLEQSKDLIDKYLTFKTHNKEFFKGRASNKKEYLKTFDIVEIGVPIKPTPGDYRLFFGRMKDLDASKFDCLRDMRTFTAGFEYEMARQPFFKGLTAVLDATGFHMGYLSRINLSTVSIALRAVQFAENKIHQVHIINCNPIIAQLVSLIKPLLSEHIQKTLRFHTTDQMEEFHEKFVPKKYMPSNWGGNLPSLADMHLDFLKEFEYAKEWCEDLDSPKYFVNETLRPKGNRNGVNAMAGSFRKLDFD